MKGRTKLILFGVVILAALLAVAGFAGVARAAFGDTPFTIGGKLTVAGTDLSIQTTHFVTTTATTCMDLTPVAVNCATLNGKVVLASISKGTTNFEATSINQQADTTVFGYTGILTAIDPAFLKLDVFDFQVGTTALPPFFKVNDQLETKYTVDLATGNFLSQSFKVLNSGVGNTYTYSNTLNAINGDIWTVGVYTFTVKGVALPPMVNVKDTVEVTFSIVNGVNVASSVKVLVTNVENKVNSNRCENRTTPNPAIVKLAKEVNADPETLGKYFCAGFGVGEIRLAYRYAANGFTPAMLLELRAQGMSWGEIRKLVAGTSTGPGNHGNGNGNGNNNGNGNGNGSGTGNGNGNGSGNGNGGNGNGNGNGNNKPNHGKNK